MNETIVTLSFEVAVTYREDVDKSYGADADGNRGTVLVERIAEHAEVLNANVPENVAGYLRALAIEHVERGAQ